MKKNHTRMWIFIILLILVIVIIGIVIWYENSGITTISESDMQEIVRGKVVDNSVPTSPKHKHFYDNSDNSDSKTVTKISVTAAIGNNTVLITGVLEYNQSAATHLVKYQSEWNKTDFDVFTNTASSSTSADYVNNWVYYLTDANYNVAPTPGNIGGVVKFPSGLRSYDRTFVPAWETFLFNIIPFLLIIGIAVWALVRTTKMSGGVGGANPFTMGKNRAREIKSTVKFSDVAGINEEKTELVELVDYLKNPQKYSAMGARAPKGVLMEGPPGTGKTLLAKAVAGEAGVPFFTISGSEFEEMFVGVGASRIREMFVAAKKAAPCIIFIDEIDAVGRKRTVSIGSAPNEQTLNQLLVEMDGFGTNSGVIVMAATNRVDVLDPALLRPGRFDRQIQISLPDINEREAILRLHARNKNVSTEVDFYRIAQRTPGFSGAQLENVLNEAAILCVRKNLKVITLDIIDEAIDRVVGGPAKESRKYSIIDKQIVSYHEAGHALIGLKLESASKVQKVTIIPRGQAGGYTIMTPSEETMFHSKENLFATITGYLGGRASEEIIFGASKVTTGAHDDLEKATNIARHMVTEYGMSALGLVQLESPKDEYQPTGVKRYSEAISGKIDSEVKKFLDDCYVHAKEIISKNRELLDLLAESLRILETITAEQIEYINENMKLPPEVLREKQKADEKKVKQERGDIIEVKPRERKKPFTDLDKKDNSTVSKSDSSETDKKSDDDDKNNSENKN